MSICACGSFKLLSCYEDDPAFPLPADLRHRAAHGANSFVKDGFKPLLCESRALKVLDCAHIFCHCQTLWVSNWGKSLLFQLVNGLLVLPQIEFGANQNDWDLGTMVPH